MSRTLAFSAFVVTLTTGCATLLALEEGVLDETVTPIVADGSAGTSSGQVAVPPVIITETCQSEQPDDAHGLFVSPSGTDVPNCGSKDTPCATLEFVSQRARLVAATKTVYIDSANYRETLTMLAPGVTFQGGWDRLGMTWRRQCVANRGGSVTISGGTEPTGVRIANLGGEATLDTLTIAVPSPTTASSQSVYGIFATGASTSLKLVDVTVVAGSGGKGAPGTTGGIGQSGMNCVAGTSNPITGGTGTGGPLGLFGPSGYTPSVGGTGLVGGSGSATTPGAPQCGPCVLNCGGISPNCSIQSLERCGEAGTGGCGGGGGPGGGGGRSGGSSLALFAFDAQITMTRGALRSGDGGEGGEGGGGGSGGSGTMGTMGPAFTGCGTNCLSGGTGTVCQKYGTRSYAGGAAGAAGSRGGNGGKGGGGSGGDSYALYTGGGAQVALDSTPLSFGKGGPPADNGAQGRAAERGP